jgi:hypothetical protein
MSNTNLLDRVQHAVNDACEMAESWVGTPIADKLDMETEALVRGIEQNRADLVTENLLPRLLSTIYFAENRLQHQEG